MNKKIVDLLMSGASTEELRKKLNLDNKELALKLNELKNDGYLLDYKFHDKYGKSVKLCKNTEFMKDIPTRISLSNSMLRCMVIADTHFGNINDNFDYIKRIYEYADKNNIRTIFHLGDLIEGYSPYLDNTEILKHIDPFEIADYIDTNYPIDNNIINYILMGNHDYRTINYSGVDISKILSKTRLDMEFLGYFNSNILLQNDKIALHHPSTSQSNIDYNKELKEHYKKIYKKPSIYLRGHCHHAHFYVHENIPVIHLPSLYDDNKTPGAMDMTLFFKDNMIESLIIRNLIVEPKVAKSLELTHKIKRGK